MNFSIVTDKRVVEKEEPDSVEQSYLDKLNKNMLNTEFC